MSKANDYQFVTKWHVSATEEEVYDLISRTEDLPRWWPSVYLQAEVLEGGQPGGVASESVSSRKGGCPTRCRWEFIVTEAVRPKRLAIAAQGDFVGTGEWTFAGRDDHVDISFSWRVRADKPLLRTLSSILKPMFSANHEWAMARGLESLDLEMRRQRAKTSHERAQIPSPPGPTFRWRRMTVVDSRQ